MLYVSKHVIIFVIKTSFHLSSQIDRDELRCILSFSNNVVPQTLISIFIGMSIISYRPADGKYRHGHSVYVLLFKQVDRLEQIDVRDAVFNASLLKPTKHVRRV